MNIPKPLKCSEVGDRKLLEALINRELTVDEEDRLLKHLKTCPVCLSELAVFIHQGNLLETGDSSFDFPNP